MMLEVLIAWMFYHNVVMILLLFPMALYFQREEMRKEERKKREEFRKSFHEGLEAFSAALKAGYAPENAIRYAARECRILYGKENLVTKEFERMAGILQMSGTPEQAFEELADRNPLPEAGLFAEVFSVARKSGGNLIQIVSDTCEILEVHMETQEEIMTALRARELEQKIMNLIPIAILLYMEITSPGYFDGMYNNPSGFFIMTACLLLYAAAYILSGRILEAESM